MTQGSMTVGRRGSSGAIHLAWNAVPAAVAEFADSTRIPGGAFDSMSTPAHLGIPTMPPNILSGSGAQGTFAALDSGTGVGTPGWTHAGGLYAEAGFQDPSLGWVGVRAGLSGGSVHVALVSESAEAAQALSAHLPGLSNYLAEEHTRVSTLTMDSPGATSGGGWAGAGSGQPPQQGTGQEQGKKASTDVQPGSPSGTVPLSGVTAQTLVDGNNGMGRLLSFGESRGMHISVVA